MFPQLLSAVSSFVHQTSFLFFFSCQALVEELEQSITQCHTKGIEDVEDYERASRALGAVGTGANKMKKGTNTPAGKDRK